MEAQQSDELRETLRLLWVRKVPILVVTVVSVALALFLSFQQTVLYQAEARVLVSGQQRSLEERPAPVNLQTESQLVASESVAARVASDPEIDHSTKALLNRLDVVPIPDTEVLLITFRDAAPEVAQDVANRFAQSYLEYKTDQAIEAVGATQRSIQSRIEELQEDLQRLNLDILDARQSGDEATATSLEAQQSVLAARIAVLEQGLDELNPDLISGFGVGEIIEEAARPQDPVTPNHTRNALLGFLGGLVCGASLAFLLDRLDQRLRGRHDLQRAAQASVLATIPRIKGLDRSARQPMLAGQSSGLASEAFRSLRTSIQFISNKERIKSFLITSPGVGEGKTTVAVNLALALAQAGRRVVLVSADLRRPTIEWRLALSAGKGLAEWLLGMDLELWAFVRNPGIPNLRVIPSGEVPPNPAELLTSPRLAELLSDLEDNADAVVIDSPPALAVADAAILASTVRSVILVANFSSTTRSEVSHASDDLRKVGASIVGTVLNGFDPSRLPYGYYYGPTKYDAEPARPQAQRYRSGFGRRRSGGRQASGSQRS